MIEIDTLAATQFETSSKTRRETLTSTAATVRAQLSGGGLSTRVADLMSELAGHVETAGTNFGDAARRASAADDTSMGAVSTPTISVDLTTQSAGFTESNWVIATPTWNKSALDAARQVARDLLDHTDDYDKVQAAIKFLEENADNPEVLAAFMEELGPEGLLQIPIRMAQEYDGRNYNDLRIAEAFKEDSERWKQAQHDLMVNLGIGLATASEKGGLDGKFAENLANLAIENQPDNPNKHNNYNAWALSQILRNGKYPDDFLITIGNLLYDHERGPDAKKGMWIDRLGDRASIYTLGNGRENGFYDPFVGLFEAMSKKPDAALTFFYPGGTEDLYQQDRKAPDRVQYLIRERTWSHDEFGALGRVLAAGALAHRDPTAPGYTEAQGQLSAMMATDAINLLGERPGEPKIGPGAFDSLSKILSSYIIDIETATVINSPDGVIGPMDYSNFGEVFTNLPPSAFFKENELHAVVAETLHDPEAMKPFVEAVKTFASYRIAGAVEGGARNGLLNAVIRNNAALLGWVIGTAGYGGESYGARQDERAEMMNDMMSDFISGIPIPGASWVTFIGGQAVSRAEDWWKVDPSNAEAAREFSWNFQYHAEQEMLRSVAVQLGELGKLPTHNPDTGKPYPWIRYDNRGQPIFIAKLALDPHNYADFMVQLQSNEDYQAIISNLNGTVKDFAENGRRGT